MKIASTSKFRKDIKRYIDDIDADQEPLVVTRSDNVSVVVLPLDLYNSYAETDYLLRSPANAAWLRRSLEHAKSDKVEKHNLIEP
ncbi:MAG TPA: type II toxin-antitoxin system Phd/YefM family antitoxin [Verrucomicrobiae bacterium]|nr:type II toxin-antitoxin system Phd/YefM family antitoxin [Verrucomicrobiae bacterium]